jgi:hypothetical protein
VRAIRVKVFLFAATSGVVFGCSEAPKVELVDRKIEWSKLFDGSLFSIVRRDESSEAAIRCWKVRSLYDCVSVRKHAQSYWAVRKEFSAPPVSEDVFDVGDGYMCERKMEWIASHSDILVKNASDIEWSNDYKSRFLQDNNVSGGKAFMCRSLLRKLFINSLRTLGTTAVSRDDI